MRTKNVHLQVLESACCWNRVIKRFKDILFFCSLYIHSKTTSFPEMALELLYLSNFNSYSHLKFRILPKTISVHKIYEAIRTTEIL